MKKIMMTLAVACAAFLMACGGVESKAKSYAEDVVDALKDKDYEKVEELEKEIEEYVDGLSKEEQKEFAKIYLAEFTDLGGMDFQ